MATGAWGKASCFSPFFRMLRLSKGRDLAGGKGLVSSEHVSRSTLDGGDAVVVADMTMGDTGDQTIRLLASIPQLTPSASNFTKGSASPSAKGSYSQSGDSDAVPMSTQREVQDVILEEQEAERSHHDHAETKESVWRERSFGRSNRESREGEMAVVEEGDVEEGFEEKVRRRPRKGDSFHSRNSKNSKRSKRSSASKMPERFKLSKQDSNLNIMAEESKDASIENWLKYGSVTGKMDDDYFRRILDSGAINDPIRLSFSRDFAAKPGHSSGRFLHA
mmetsp:Transcript_58519/g.137461  ORF Transcript_58519/g.137461 Transcript_58519/m.137461 type:complete len:277 (+) Transcript_58519:92-922(+)